MSDASAPGEPRRTPSIGASRRGGRRPEELFAALDLGTNNCRLLVAARARDGFRIIDAYSRIVRLGEGLSQTGRLQPAAMQRAMEALKVCADRIHRRGATKLRAVATQACRSAENGAEFIARVTDETGLSLDIITPEEEASLSVAGCVNLLDWSTKAALVLDVGGGSSELSWVDLAATPRGAHGAPRGLPSVKAWISAPIGVVTLAERFPERRDDPNVWFRDMVEAVKALIVDFRGADSMREVFEDGDVHLIGTSGAITSLAGVHLQLERYDRNRVDGLWMSHAECEAITQKLLAFEPHERAAQPCIGPDRADLVLAGAAILQAVQELWPCERVRVADRGLREGLLLSLMQRPPKTRKPRRRRRAPRPAAQETVA
jgi:exopolyphosphatase/guanosine-5'-triphosphate,3'-diphosphate pyrophosphatase